MERQAPRHRPSWCRVLLAADDDWRPTEARSPCLPWAREVLEGLDEHTGLSLSERLAPLSRELPDAVDRFAPDGRISAA